MKRFALTIVAVLSAAPGLAQAPRPDPAAECASPDVAKAIAACTQALALPGLPNARRAAFAYNRGYNLYRQGRINDAIRDYTAAISLDGSNPQFFNNRGFAYKSVNQFAAAVADFSKAIESQPTNHVFYYNRGLAYEGAGDHVRAAADFEKAVGVNPGFALGHVSLGRSLARAGRRNDALARFAQTVTRFPQNAFIHTERGKLLLDMKQYDDAIADFSLALQYEPRSVFGLHGRGVGYMEKGDYARALADLDAALTINSRYALAYADRGNVHYKMENYAAAIEDYTQSLANLPTNTLAFNNRGNAKHKLGRHAEALIDYTQALALDPRYAEAYSNRAETYVWLSDYDRAITDFRQAVALAPTMEPAQRGLTRVQEIRAKRVAAAPEPAPVGPPVAVSPTPPSPAPGTPPPAGSARRVALVIGNATYQNTQALTNPTNDAGDVAASLRRLNFEVIEEKNLSKSGMDDAFRRFARLTKDADVALFFYAGHAMQFQGTNYLMPVDAKLKDETDLPYEMSKFNDVMEDMSRVKNVRIAIIDACRDNPLEQKLKRSIARTRGAGAGGLAPISKAEGSIVVYATQAGSVAGDGEGRNSPFTTALLTHIEAPSLEIGILFRRVAGAVREATKGQQFPEISLSLVGEVYLKSN